MPLLSPQLLRPGQVLAEDAYNFDSKLLFSAGTELSEKQIETLMMWGVEKVAVRGESDSPAASSKTELSRTAKQEAERLVKNRFKLVKSSHPVVLALREIASIEAAKACEQKAQRP